jgi:hypothetical protein
MPDPTRNALKAGSIWYPFISLSGEVQSLVPLAEDISRPGVNGTAVRQLGKQGKRFEMIGIVDCDSLSAAIDLSVELQGLQGGVYGPLLDAYGATSETVIVWDVQRLRITPIIVATGGLSSAKAAMLTMRFVFQRPNPPGS